MPKKIKMVTNPTPLGLLTVNPKGAKKMAAKKRSSTKKRTTTAHHRTTTHKAHKKAPARARARANPKKHVRRNRRRSRGGFLGFRNPVFNTGLIMEGVGLAAGSALTAFTVSLIPTSLGGTSQTADLIRTGAAAWLLGEAAKMLGMPRLGRVITLGGVALLGGKLIYGLIIPTAQDVFKPKQQAAMPGKAGMSAVVALPSGQYDSYYGSTPLAAPRRVVAPAAATAANGGNAMTRAAAATTRSGVGAVWTGRLRY